MDKNKQNIRCKKTENVVHNEPMALTKKLQNSEFHSPQSLVTLFIYLIHVHIYPYRLGNPLDVEQVIVRNAYTHKNKITTRIGRDLT